MHEREGGSDHRGKEQFRPEVIPEQRAQSDDAEKSDGESVIVEGIVAGEDEVNPGGGEAEEEE